MDCACCVPTVAAQSLDEVAFAKSICAAAGVGDIPRVRAFLQKNPQSVHSDGMGGTTGYTPLHYAAREGHAGVVSLLIAFGADPNRATTAGGATPLHRASFTGRAEVVRQLLEAGADALLQDVDGQTPLHKALQQGHTEVGSLLAAAAPEAVEVRDAKGRLPRDLL